MAAKSREGGPTWRRAGRVEVAAGRNGACGASAKPAAAERLVSGVPPAPSTGGGDGLPDLPREGRGWGVLSLGGAGHGRNMACRRHSGNRLIWAAQQAGTPSLAIKCS